MPSIQLPVSLCSSFPRPSGSLCSRSCCSAAALSRTCVRHHFQVVLHGVSPPPPPLSLFSRSLSVLCNCPASPRPPREPRSSTLCAMGLDLWSCGSIWEIIAFRLIILLVLFSGRVLVGEDGGRHLLPHRIPQHLRGLIEHHLARGLEAFHAGLRYHRRRQLIRRRQHLPLRRRHVVCHKLVRLYLGHFLFHRLGALGARVRRMRLCWGYHRW
mmetsp:Transcript_56202/g.132430  ORF Transcript_56202/g.132430 Transcript_56202/m.132430 type:complete len:213 (-) Transcript_56202:292-930(-)